MFSQHIFSGSRMKTVLVLCLGTILLLVLTAQSAAAQATDFYYPRHANWTAVGAKQSRTMSIGCRADNDVIASAGFETQAVSGNQSGGFKVIHSYPEDRHTWKFRLRNSDDVDRNVKLYAVCVLAQ